jgi:hypothetical protein
MSVISDRSEQVMFGRMRRDLPKANVHSYCRAAYPPDSKQPNEHRREVISQPSLKRAAGREHVKRTGPMALTCDLTPAGGACKNLFQNAIFVGLAHMSDQCRKPSNALLLRQRALAISDNEGGAGLDGPLAEAAAVESRVPMPSNDVAEVRALHVRIIALENIVISLLADASDRQIEQVREMASYISPRPGFTHHPLTTHAAAHMVDLGERASRFRSRTSA